MSSSHSATPSPARILILMTRKEGMSKEDFNRYWNEVHTPLIAMLDDIKGRTNKYEKGYTNTEMSDAVRAIGFDVASEYDGIVILEAESHEKLNQMLQSEGFQKGAMGDGMHFLKDARFIPLDTVTVW
ncbi:hypothetical protein C8R46DRAFT_1278468 [Mycena filopes]|nr:hypothetical protein C8R46DRAFT_1278468 [Mycena filopes]